jgi:hypothetical protein
VYDPRKLEHYVCRSRNIGKSRGSLNGVGQKNGSEQFVVPFSCEIRRLTVQLRRQGGGNLRLDKSCF